MKAASFRPAPDARSRREALDPRRSFLVEAPAGSGKTELLIQRFLLLLGRAAQPENVLAITFTRKAAGEMRQRVLEALDRADRQTPPTSENDRLTLELAAEAARRSAELGWNLAGQPSRLRVQTIDALCASLVARMPFLARFGAPPQVVDDASLAFRDAARATLRLLDGPPEFASAIAQVALHLDGDLRLLRDRLLELLARRDQWLAIFGPGTNIAALRAPLEDLTVAHLSGRLARLAAAVPPGATSALSRFSGLKAMPSASLADLGAWRDLAALLLTNQGQLRRSVNRRQGFAPGRAAEKEDFLSFLESLAPHADFLDRLHATRSLPEPRLDDNQWSLLESIGLLLGVAAAQLKLTFRELGIVDFVEVAEAARRALGSVEAPTDLALTLGEQFEHILVDEMQDTSHVQLELLRLLTASWEPEDGRTLFLVGDPKQSIYLFRDADVGGFLRLRQTGLGVVRLEPLTLSANFRSRPALIRWANRVLPTAFPDRDDHAEGAVTYSPSEPFRDDSPKASVRIHPLLSPDPAEEARLVLELLSRSTGAAAILVRSRTHAAAIVALLGSRGIPFRAVDLDPLGETPAVADLLALTRALFHPADRTAWLAILRAPWCGLRLADLYRLAPAPDKTVWDLLPAVAWSEDAQGRVERLRQILAPIRDQIRRVPLRRCLEAAWQNLGGPLCHPHPYSAAAVAAFLDLIERLDHAGEIADLNRLEQEAAALFAPPDPSAVAREQEDQPALQIMTIHKAKGLEFDTVIIPGLGRSVARDETPLVEFAEVDEAGATGWLLAPSDASRHTSEASLFQYLRRLRHRREANETSRLLYVAATRAREQLHLIGQVPVGASGAVGRPARGSLLELLWPAVEHEFTRAWEARPQPSQLNLDLPPSRPMLRRLPLHALPPPPAHQPRAAPAAAALPDHDESRESAHTGTVIHSFLEVIARQGLALWDTESVRRRRPAIRRALAALGVDSAVIARAAARVEEALLRTLNDSRGRWILSPHPEAACEFPLSGVLAGENVHCVVDRTFVDASGLRWVIDYKCGAPADPDAVAAFVEAEFALHRPQLERYAALFRALEPARPVRLGLYFPLVGGWREWTGTGALGTVS